MPFSSMYFVMNGEDVMLVDVHTRPSLEDGFSSHESIGSKDREIWMSTKDLSMLHTLFPMYSSTMTSTIPSSSYEYG